MIPLKDRVIVLPERQDEFQTAAGIHVLDDFAEPSIGRVKFVTPESDFAPEDVVIFSPLSGSRLDHAGEHYLVLREDDILAVWE